MLKKSLSSIKSVIQTIDYRMLLFVLMLVLFLLGAGAPGATGIGGG